MNEENHSGILELVKQLKDLRNDVAHYDPKVINWTLKTFQEDIMNTVHDLLEKLSDLFPEVDVISERQKIEKYFQDIIEDVRDKEEVLEVMKSELETKYGREVDIVFYQELNPDNDRVGSLKHFVLPRLLMEQREMGLNEISRELSRRNKGLLIEGQPGTGKTCISW